MTWGNVHIMPWAPHDTVTFRRNRPLALPLARIPAGYHGSSGKKTAACFARGAGVAAARAPGPTPACEAGLERGSSGARQHVRASPAPPLPRAWAHMRPSLTHSSLQSGERHAQFQGAARNSHGGQRVAAGAGSPRHRSQARRHTRVRACPAGCGGGGSGACAVGAPQWGERRVGLCGARRVRTELSSGHPWWGCRMQWESECRRSSPTRARGTGCSAAAQVRHTGNRTAHAQAHATHAARQGASEQRSVCTNPGFGKSQDYKAC